MESRLYRGNRLFRDSELLHTGLLTTLILGSGYTIATEAVTMTPLQQQCHPKDRVESDTSYQHLASQTIHDDTVIDGKE